MKKLFFIYFLIIVIWVSGYIQCIVKFVKSDFDAPYKREIIYGVSMFIFPVGGIVGWVNIEDGDKDER